MSTVADEAFDGFTAADWEGVDDIVPAGVEVAGVPVVSYPGLPPVEFGSVPAQALLEVWSGVPATVVSSPPGAGKTMLIATVAPHLAVRGRFRVGVAATSKSQCVEVANRIFAAGSGLTVRVCGSSADPGRLSGLLPGVEYGSTLDLGAPGSITVSTVAKWKGAKPTGAVLPDVLIVDEAWQVTFADLMQLGRWKANLLLVGDPGQIAPVVTAVTGRWEGRKNAPFRPAPDVLAEVFPDDLASLQFSHSRRLGPDTVRLIGPLYDFEFGSARPDTTVVDADGAVVPEVGQVLLDDVVGQVDSRMVDAVAAAAIEALSFQVSDDRGVRAASVKVVVPHVDQSTAIVGALDRLGRGVARQVQVDTANRLQGLEADVVIAVDPMIGQVGVPSHSVDPGRLCVSLSRHRGAVRWVTARQVMDVLMAEREVAVGDGDAALVSVLDRNIEVRRVLAAC